jgi:hypothetical protein
MMGVPSSTSWYIINLLFFCGRKSTTKCIYTIYRSDISCVDGKFKFKILVSWTTVFRDVKPCSIVDRY